MEDCYKEYNLVYSTYSADPSVSVNLENHQEGRPVEEEHVSLPVSWVVMSLSIDSSWNWP